MIGRWTNQKDLERTMSFTHTTTLIKASGSARPQTSRCWSESGRGPAGLGREARCIDTLVVLGKEDEGDGIAC